MARSKRGYLMVPSFLRECVAQRLKPIVAIGVDPYLQLAYKLQIFCIEDTV